MAHNNLKRIFIGLPISTLGPFAVQGINWTKKENHHLTLRFLGNVDNEKIPALSQAIAEITKEINAFTINFKSIGLFPTSHPHCLIVHITLNEALATLFYQINEACNKLGFQPNKRPFIPHVTLARFKHPPELTKLNNSIQLPETETINEVILYESQTTSDGSIYKQITVERLKPPFQ